MDSRHSPVEPPAAPGSSPPTYGVSPSQYPYPYDHGARPERWNYPATPPPRESPRGRLVAWMVGGLLFFSKLNSYNGIPDNEFLPQDYPPVEHSWVASGSNLRSAKRM